MVDQPAVLYQSDTSAERQAYDAYQRDLCQAAANYITALFDYETMTGQGTPATAAKLGSFISRIVLAGSISPPILLAALVYLSRLKARHPPSTGASGARLFLTALVLGQKILQDGPFLNQTWVRLIRGHYSLLELACMERELLAFLAWDLSVEVDQLLAVEDLVMTYYRSSPSARPVPPVASSLNKRSDVPFPSAMTAATFSERELGHASGSASAPSTAPTRPAVDPPSVPAPLVTPPQTPIVDLTSPRPRSTVATMPHLAALSRSTVDGTSAAVGPTYQRHRRAAHAGPTAARTPESARKTTPLSRFDRLPLRATSSRTINHTVERPHVLSVYRAPAPAPPLARPIVASRSSSAISSLSVTAARSPATVPASINFSRPMSRACSAANLAFLGSSHEASLPITERRAAAPAGSGDESASGSSSSSSSALSSALPSPIGPPQIATTEGKLDSHHQAKPSALSAPTKAGGIFSFGLLRGWRSTIAGQPIAAA